MRKIVQIAYKDESPVVLCDDGSAWIGLGWPVEWQHLPDIPQDEPATRGNG